MKFRILGNLRICGRLIVTQLDPMLGTPPIFQVSEKANFTSGEIRLNGTSIPITTLNATISIATFGANPNGTRLGSIVVDQEPLLDCRQFTTDPKYETTSLSVSMGIVATECNPRATAYNNVVAIAVPIAIVAVVIIAVAIGFGYWYQKKRRYAREAKMVKNKIAASRGASASQSTPMKPVKQT
jgi:hypothetical protein